MNSYISYFHIFLIIQSEIIDPAVKGTLNVLRSCAKVASIKRVIVTSSMASVLYKRKPLDSDVVVDETWFSDPAICEELKVCLYAIISSFWFIFNKVPIHS